MPGAAFLTGPSSAAYGPRMDRPKTIAVANDKGGVGKTTTSAVFCHLLASEGHRVLVVDFDRQANLSKKLVVDPRAVGRGRRRRKRVPIEQLLQDAGQDMIEVLLGRKDFKDIALPARSIAGVDVATSGNILDNLKQILENDPATCDGGYGALRRALKRAAGHWDYVVIDCPANNLYFMKVALWAAHDVVIPTVPSHYALEGLVNLTNVVAAVREQGNPELNLAGVLALNVPGNSNEAHELFRLMHKNYGDFALSSYVRACEAVRASDGTSKAITGYRSTSSASLDYQDVWQELSPRWSWKEAVA